MTSKQRWGAAPALFVAGILLAAAAACAFNSPDRLNDGRGTRDNPVPARVFAKTPQYEVRALSVLRPIPVEGQSTTSEDASTDIGSEYMKVQFEVLCDRDPEEICNLTELREKFQLVGGEGVLFPPDYTLEIDDPLLEGEILGGAQKPGWLVYRVPTGLPVAVAVVEYGEGLRVFFRLP